MSQEDYGLSSQQIEEHEHLPTYLEQLKTYSDKKQSAKEFRRLVTNYFGTSADNRNNIFERNPKHHNKSILHYLAKATYDHDLEDLFHYLTNDLRTIDPFLLEIGKGAANFTPLEYSLAQKNVPYAFLIARFLFPDPNGIEKIFVCYEHIIQFYNGYTSEEKEKIKKCYFDFNSKLLPYVFTNISECRNLSITEKIIEIINQEKFFIGDDIPENGEQKEPLLHLIVKSANANFEFCQKIVSALMPEVIKKLNSHENKFGDDVVLYAAFELKNFRALKLFDIFHQLGILDLRRKSSKHGSNFLHKVFRNNLFTIMPKILDKIVVLAGNQEIEWLVCNKDQKGTTPIADALIFRCEQSPQKGQNSAFFTNFIECLKRLIEISPLICTYSLDKENHTLLWYLIKYKELHRLIDEVILKYESFDEEMQKIAFQQRISLDERKRDRSEWERKNKNKNELPRYYVEKGIFESKCQEIEELKKENAWLQKNRDANRQDLERLRSERNKFREDFDVLQKEKQELEESLKEGERNEIYLTQENIRFDTAQKELRKRLETSEMEKAQIVKIQEQHNQEKINMQKENKASQESFEKKIKTMEEDSIHSKKILDETHVVTKNQALKIDELKKNEQELKKTLEVFQKERVDLQEKIAGLERRLEKSVSENKSLVLRSSDEKSEREQQIGLIKEQYEPKNKALEKKVSELESQHSVDQQKIKILEEQKMEFEREIDKQKENFDLLITERDKKHDIEIQKLKTEVETLRKTVSESDTSNAWLSRKPKLTTTASSPTFFKNNSSDANSSGSSMKRPRDDSSTTIQTTQNTSPPEAGNDSTIQPSPAKKQKKADSPDFSENTSSASSATSSMVVKKKTRQQVIEKIVKLINVGLEFGEIRYVGNRAEGKKFLLSGIKSHGKYPQQGSEYYVFVLDNDTQILDEDFLDEIKELLAKNDKAGYKILFPYCFNEKNILALGEIRIFNENEKYKISIVIHNPEGGALPLRIDSEVYKNVNKLATEFKISGNIEKGNVFEGSRLNVMDDETVDKFLFSASIMIEDLFTRILGEPLKEYKATPSELRKKHQILLKNYNQSRGERKYTESNREKSKLSEEEKKKIGFDGEKYLFAHLKKHYQRNLVPHTISIHTTQTKNKDGESLESRFKICGISNAQGKKGQSIVICLDWYHAMGHPSMHYDMKKIKYVGEPQVCPHQERVIEIKTTRSDKELMAEVTGPEFQELLKHKHNYRFYRVYSINEEQKTRHEKIKLFSEMQKLFSENPDENSSIKVQKLGLKI